MNQLTKEELETIGKIAKRASNLLHWDRFTVLMDVSTVHEDTCPLRLEDLLQSDDANFAHDIVGINQNLNHITHRLDNEFIPRFAV